MISGLAALNCNVVKPVAALTDFSVLTYNLQPLPRPPVVCLRAGQRDEEAIKFGLKRRQVDDSG